MKLEVRVTPRVRDLIANLAPDDRASFEQHLDVLTNDPYVDNLTKFAVAYPPVVVQLYQDGPYRIVYRIVSNTIVDLLNIGIAPYVPPVAEWDAWFHGVAS